VAASVDEADRVEETLKKIFLCSSRRGELNVPQKKKTDEILDKNCEINQQSDS
jgi:hypothetical protein